MHRPRTGSGSRTWFAAAALALFGAAVPLAPLAVHAGEPGASRLSSDDSLSLFPSSSEMRMSVTPQSSRWPMSYASSFAPVVEQMPARKNTSSADLVVIVSIDGLRPDAISHRETRNLWRLYTTGVAPHRARTIDKSSTLPSHASMMSGFEPHEHGLNFNAYRPERGHIHVPTVFSLAREAGLPTWMFVGKKKLKLLLDGQEHTDFEMAGIFCQRVVRESTPILRVAENGVVFIHFADPDSAGHRDGWMTTKYHEAVKRADRCLGQLVEVLEERGHMDRTLLMVTADHGGHGRSHGTRLQTDQRIPWFAWGAGANARRRVQRTVHTMDTAATALAALGITLPQGIEGQPVLEALGAIEGPAGMPLVGAPLE